MCVIKNEVVKKTQYNELAKVNKVNNINTDYSDLVKKTDYNTNLMKLERKLLIMIMMIILLLKNLIN